MNRTLVAAVIVWLTLPPAAYAADALGPMQAVSLVTGVTSLLLSAMLLVVVVQLRRVADGSAIVEHISYVVGASLCLVASILVGWFDRFVGVSTAQAVRVAADVLVTVSLLLFAVYFTRVRRALSSFLSHISGDQLLAAANAADVGEDAVA